LFFVAGDMSPDVRILMPNKRGDDRKNLQAWVDAELGEQFKNRAKIEGLAQNELLVKILTKYFTENSNEQNANSVNSSVGGSEGVGQNGEKKSPESEQ
jgi:hypothetical protein